VPTAFQPFRVFAGYAHSSSASRPLACAAVLVSNPFQAQPPTGGRNRRVPRLCRRAGERSSQYPRRVVVSPQQPYR